MVDERHAGPHRDLWALPSEALPPGAAAFLDMVREVGPATLEDPAEPDVEAPLAPVVPLRADIGSGAGGPAPPPGGSQPVLTPAGSPGDEGADDPGARLFLELVERAATVRALRPEDEEPGAFPAQWLSAEHGEGSQHSEAVLLAIEQAMRHVSQSDDMSEEVRARLLDLFTDFAVRRPWKGEEGRRAQARPPAD